EDGIRDFHVTGVQTCALPISRGSAAGAPECGLGTPRCRRSPRTRTRARAATRSHRPAAAVATAVAAVAAEAEAVVVAVAAEAEEIGRASCRERGEGWGVAGGV